MTIVFIPPQLRKLTRVAEVEVDGGTVREVIELLEQQFPGIKERLFTDGQLLPTLQLSVDHRMTRVVSTKVLPKTEIHFLPVIGGG